MPFGLHDAAATFQRVLEIILSGVRWKMCLVLMEKVAIFSKNNGQHAKDIGEVLTYFHQTEVILELPKCHFFKNLIDYFGHILIPGCLVTSFKNVEAIKAAVSPIDSTPMRSFLDACNVYRIFIKDFSRTARSLKDQRWKNKNFIGRIIQPRL